MNSMQAKRLFLAVVFIIGVCVIQGCGGKGGGTAPATKAPAVANSKIDCSVTIKGESNLSGVVVVAEKVVGGVTRTVDRMLSSAKGGKQADRSVLAEADGVYTTATDDKGKCSLLVPEDTYSVTAYKENTLGAQPQMVTARSAAAVTVNFDLVATGKVSGTAVLGVSGTDIVVVYLDGTSFAAFAASDGSYTISNVPVGTYSIVFTRGGKQYATNSGVAVESGLTTNSSLTSVDFTCVMDTDCADTDLYTADSCSDPATASSSCLNEQVACVTDTDCNDSNAATTDSCVNPGLADAYCSNAIKVTEGYITTDTTWRLQDSPITVNGQLQVETGVTLTIEPGVVVQFKYPGPCNNNLFGGSYCYLGGIKVDGTLNAVGTAASPITFTLTPAAAETYGPGFWGGIYFTSTATGALQYANMVYPSYAIQVDGSSPTISNVNITKADYPEQSGNGSYHIYVKTENGWQEVAIKHHGLMYTRNMIDISKYLPDADGEYKVRIAQSTMHAAHIDSIELMVDGRPMKPVSAYDTATGADALYKVVGTDNDVIDAHLKTFEVAFNVPGGATSSSVGLALIAREEGDQVITGGKPIIYPQNRFYESVETAKHYDYQLGSNSGALTVDGELTGYDYLPAPAFVELTTPQSGHPQGYVYGYMKNDNGYLYALLDFTPDNTYDDNLDYATLHVKVGNEYKSFRVSVPETRYGTVGFTYTGNVNYQHKVYEFRIPLTEIGNPSAGDNIQYIFEAYGTTSIFGSVVYVGGATDFSMSDVSISFNEFSTGYLTGMAIEYMSGTGNHTLQNITIKNTYAYGMYLYSVSNVSINGLTISDTRNDAGLFLDSADNISCTNCSVTNTLNNNSNVYMYSITNSTFSNCEFNYGYGGAAIYSSSGLTFTNCDFSFNGGSGNGIQSEGSSFDITNSRFRENCGDGLYVYGYGAGETVNVSDTNIILNGGNYGIINGGGVTLNFTGVYIEGNHGAGAGVVDTTTGDSVQKTGVSSVTSPATSPVSGTPNGPGTMPNCPI